MKIFVTGATGFVGMHTVRLLSQKGHDLMLLIRQQGQNPLIAGTNNRQARIVHGDLSGMDNWKKDFIDFSPEALLHIAWEGLPDYSFKMCRRNFDYGLNLFIMAAEAGCKTIMSIGSCWEYYEKKGLLNEDSKIDSTKIFPAFKNALRIAGEAIANKYGIDFYWPRLFFVYGPGQRKSSLIPSVIRAVLRGETPDVKNLQNKNDFIYIEDAANAIVKILEKTGRIVYNIGSGHSTSVLEMLSIVYGAMGCLKNDFIGIKQMDNHIGDDFWADITAIKSDIGWTPQISLSEGIRATVQYVAGLEKRGA